MENPNYFVQIECCWNLQTGISFNCRCVDDLESQLSKHGTLKKLYFYHQHLTVVSSWLIQFIISSHEGWAPQNTQLGIVGLSRQQLCCFSFPQLFCLGLLFSLRAPCYN
jgi:hypothetical protein